MSKTVFSGVLNGMIRVEPSGRMNPATALWNTSAASACSRSLSILFSLNAMSRIIVKNVIPDVMLTKVSIGCTPADVILTKVRIGCTLHLLS